MNVDAVTLELGMILVSGFASILVLVLSLFIGRWASNRGSR